MKRFYLILALAVLFAPSCTKTEAEWNTGSDELPENFGPNFFGYNMMNTYYLWNSEIQEGLRSWSSADNPAEKVKSIRYKDAYGNDIDRWTMMTDDFTTFSSSVDGTSTTFGYSLAFYSTSGSNDVEAFIRYTSEGSPARLAGLSRGQSIRKVDGIALTRENFSAIASERLYGEKPVEITLSDGSSMKLSPVNMYEEPVLLTKVFEGNGRRIGYMVYNGFTLESWSSLVTAFNGFKEKGIDDLILDLRYNQGGYVITENLLASMIAPKDAVEKGMVFSKEIYNSDMGNEETRFSWTHTVPTDGGAISVNTSSSNPGIDRLYAIVTGSSASASESLLTGLIPYLDVTMIGSRTYGKYCGGVLMSSAKWYESVKEELIEKDERMYRTGVLQSADWGIYLMVSRYADVYGNTPSMPSGMEPDIECEDMPNQPFQLGDPGEHMLKTALELAGFNVSGTKSAPGDTRTADELDYLPEGYGIRIIR